MTYSKTTTRLAIGFVLIQPLFLAIVAAHTGLDSNAQAFLSWVAASLAAYLVRRPLIAALRAWERDSMDRNRSTDHDRA